MILHWLIAASNPPEVVEAINFYIFLLGGICGLVIGAASVFAAGKRVIVRPIMDMLDQVDGELRLLRHNQTEIGDALPDVRLVHRVEDLPPPWGEERRHYQRRDGDPPPPS